MHVPDGFFDGPVSVAAGAVAVTAVAVSLKGARRELDERAAPLAGLVAAFVFAVQMINFPVGAGTSGHLMGGALAAILVGPYTAVLCLSVVLMLQALLFADGGITALGVNITLLGVVAVLVAYPLFRLLAKVLPRRRSSLTAASFVSALVSVPVAAMVFTLLFAVGGTADISTGAVFAAMTGVHTAIGVGEGVITAFAVGAVLAARPDLVHGARGLRAPLVLRDASGSETEVPAAAPRPAAARSIRPLWAGGLAATVVCAGFLSFYASSELDGLERVATDHEIIQQAEDSATADSPLADYGVEGVDDERLSGGLAGLIGVTAALGVGTGFYLLARRREAGRNAPGTATPERESV
ncbi:MULTISPECIES: energy-coupling factor ABC transporter permease [unclassified Streptomyces]|uniref:energy-coupling factor ABC transporter permease n=1 Tax=unclassified Streptomyces TaxID=2593676 RepID=UPI0022B7216A|nr:MULTISPECIES: energy-coupling factor ABC transporter permease [unclassified Streptomyces]MCZ7414744.1 energy-coupling factor ABC transporter permease [Streptomyces sp. WMMC897]MCZ7431667.1 energy-coupling factor ABC transporter permease [Streptomyces sp. WMMC1477]